MFNPVEVCYLDSVMVVCPLSKSVMAVKLSARESNIIDKPPSTFLLAPITPSTRQAPLRLQLAAAHGEVGSPRKVVDVVMLPRATCCTALLLLRAMEILGTKAVTPAGVRERVKNAVPATVILRESHIMTCDTGPAVGCVPRVRIWLILHSWMTIAIARLFSVHTQ